MEFGVRISVLRRIRVNVKAVRILRLALLFFLEIPPYSEGFKIYKDKSKGFQI